ncbi:MarR family transcriptional regulator [Novosphingobium sp. ZN18A2]|uniref:MarR family transcriptional regulator n=1 Tax=Novosphingobium sp. ZN18A2 TaxID=3079861 RepID=UPI0030CDA5BC
MDSRRQIERSLTMRMAPVARAWRQLADRALASLGVSESAARAIAYLDRLGPDTRQGDLARAIGIAEPSLVRTLQQIERAGLIVRVADDDDRRANRLRLTAQGADLAGRIDECLAAERARLLAGFDDSELRLAVRLLETMASRISEGLGR